MNINNLAISCVDEGVSIYRALGGVLIDVRTIEEYKEGYINGAINIPLDSLDEVKYEKDTMIFIYCHSGARATKAVEYLRGKGYTNLLNIGGIIEFQGIIKR